MEITNLSPKTCKLFEEAFRALEEEVVQNGEGITCRLEIDGGGWVDDITDAAWDLLNLNAENDPDMVEETKKAIRDSEPEDTKIKYQFKLKPEGVIVDRVVCIGPAF